MDLIKQQFAPETTYLNTASMGLTPARTVSAVRRGAETMAAGLMTVPTLVGAEESARASFARLVGTETDRVALGSVVSPMVGAVAAGLPPGAEVLLAEGEFTSLVQPFVVRDDLSLRFVPLDRIAEEVGPRTELVAVSAVQSVDGGVPDLPALRAAARTHGARTLLDITQAAGWFPIVADDWDYTVCGAYKWLLCPRGVSFLTVRPEAADRVVPVAAGWYAGAEDPWSNCYGPVTLASSARRFDVSTAWLPYLGAAASLRLVEEIGVDWIGAHDVALAARFRAGLRELGHEVPDAPSAIVSVPGLGRLEADLASAGIRASMRADGLRFAFHLYNTDEDVDRVLDVLSTATAAAR